MDVGQQLRRLEARLSGEHEEHPPEVVHSFVDEALSRFTGARVSAFVPILVERRVRARMKPSPRPDRVDLPRGQAFALDSPYAEPMSLRTWAWFTAKRLLERELPRRWAHTRGVASTAARIAPLLPLADRQILIASAWLHDIGYAEDLIDTGFHQLDGARFLRREGIPVRVCALVAHHAGAAAVAELRGLAPQLAEFDDERSAVRDALWYSDMTTSPDGDPVVFADRMREIRSRRGPDDPVVRALDVNGDERAAAVRRTEELLWSGARLTAV
ncbi:hypothetical protein GCM10027445_44070 [Amycolatopsis endophytica]|uniref:Putative nucleotidyltransferase with HDIG domain n=1 Tax=Amycolatopsis endophytica TaxID=860233 RepID=A0A853BEY2_9PSEU|nr:HD domain-containing protein [Amycolatopsis endophytica]NYI93232.1 putative nucleotidyltransferase with HDIG domain [Amycolatopsis endophytica]